MGSLQDIIIIVGLGGVGVLWVAAVVGMLQIGWGAIMGPVTDRLKNRE